LNVIEITAAQVTDRKCGEEERRFQLGLIPEVYGEAIVYLGRDIILKLVRHFGCGWFYH
jgi:hypothetical protein